MHNNLTLLRFSGCMATDDGVSVFARLHFFFGNYAFAVAMFIGIGLKEMYATQHSDLFGVLCTVLTGWMANNNTLQTRSE